MWCWKYSYVMLLIWFFVLLVMLVWLCLCLSCCKILRNMMFKCVIIFIFILPGGCNWFMLNNRIIITLYMSCKSFYLICFLFIVLCWFCTFNSCLVMTHFFRNIRCACCFVVRNKLVGAIMRLNWTQIL